MSFGLLIEVVALSVQHSEVLNRVHYSVIRSLFESMKTRVCLCALCFDVVQDMGENYLNSFKCLTKTCKDVHPVYPQENSCDKVQACIKYAGDVSRLGKISREAFIAPLITLLESMTTMSKSSRKTNAEKIRFAGEYMCRSCQKDFDEASVYYVCQTCGSAYHVTCTVPEEQEDIHENEDENNDAEDVALAEDNANPAEENVLSAEENADTQIPNSDYGISPLQNSNQSAASAQSPESLNYSTDNSDSSRSRTG